MVRYREYLGDGKWHYWGELITGEFIPPKQYHSSKKLYSYQFLELYDVDGHEIWEGGIIVVEYVGHNLNPAFFPPSRPQLVYKDRDECATGFIPFTDGCGGCMSDAMKALIQAKHLDDYDSEYGHYIVRVVGNIEQNPELVRTI